MNIEPTIWPEVHMYDEKWIKSKQILIFYIVQSTKK